MGKTDIREGNDTQTIVKVNGNWKIADKLSTPGFNMILGIIGLIVVAYLIRFNKR